MKENQKIKADIVLLTVNKHEQSQLTAVLEEFLGCKLCVTQGSTNEIYLDAGVINNQRVIVAKSLLGSTDSGASFDTVNNILHDLSPQTILAVGIAWGAKNADGQEIGDILLSTRLRAAQHHKVTPEKVVLRSTIESAHGTLVKTLSAAAPLANKRVHEGLLLSIETLFDDEKERDKFIAADQHQAIGGEMEGSGLLMSLQRAEFGKVDWLIVKAICDWGFKKNDDEAKKEQDQIMAARNAAELCLVAIKNFRLVREVRVQSRDQFTASYVDPSAQSRATISPSSTILPERSIAKTVQAYIGKNSSFSLDVGFPIKHKDWNEKIVFELYRLTDELGGSKYFLYVHESASQSGTLVYLRQNGLIKRGCHVIVLTEKPSGLKESERRKENLQEVFDTDNVFFIDEFGQLFLYKEHMQGFIPFNVPVYIESLADKSLSGSSESALYQLKSWYVSAAEPLMVIRGYGGLGKTTLVKKFLNEINSSNADTEILFIDSHEIIGELESISRTREKIDDIYDFYDAQSINPTWDSKRLSKELLSLSVDNGSLLIVLDGIDEVIAKLGAKFDAVSFIRSISTIYSTNLRRAKIIITCRDYFWDSLQEVSSVKRIDLQPFNRKMAEEYFGKSLDSSKAEKALLIADKFALKPLEGGEEVYVPYILDLIVYLIKQKAEFGGESLDFAGNGSLLRSEIPNDFLVANVCQREIVKLYNLSVDSQIEFFVQLSVAKDGHISIYDVKSLLVGLNSHGERNIEDTIERLKGHPLLVYSNHRLYFRYDFFNEYFKSLYVARYFLNCDLKLLNSEFIDVAADYLRFDGDFMSSVCQRLQMSDELLLFGIETVDELCKEFEGMDAQSRYNRKRARSGVFSLFLGLSRDSGNIKFDMQMCSGLLNDFFSKAGAIRDLSLINVGSNVAAKPVFDLRGMVLKDCYFERYDFFWECLIDQETRFKNSTFKSLEPRKDVRPNFYEFTFDDQCDTSDIAHLLAKKKESAAHHMAVIREDLIRLFRLFYSRGNFYPQKQEYIRSKVFTGPYLSILLRNKIIEEYVDSQKATLRQYRVNSKYAAIVKHIEQGSPSIELDMVSRLFSK